MLLKAIKTIMTTDKGGNRVTYLPADIFNVTDEEGEQLIKKMAAMGVKKEINVSINPDALK